MTELLNHVTHCKSFAHKYIYMKHTKNDKNLNKTHDVVQLHHFDIACSKNYAKTVGQIAAATTTTKHCKNPMRSNKHVQYQKL